MGRIVPAWLAGTLDYTRGHGREQRDLCSPSAAAARDRSIYVFAVSLAGLEICRLDLGNRRRA
jgi:hypothetical protein